MSNTPEAGSTQGKLQALLELIRHPDPIKIERSHHIFCNKDTNFNEVEAIGFDMDYTLAVYHQDQMDRLSVELTIERLIRERGYPEAIQTIIPKPDFAIRGLVVDTLLGNILKLDSHRHVGRAYHGFRELTEEELQTYRAEVIRFNGTRYALVDTLYALPEAFLYAALVHYWESAKPGQPHNWRQLYDDIRFSIDLAHRDDSIKEAILSDLPRYINRDPELANTLHRFRSSGKKLFLLTNSYPEYTDKLMTYLLDGAMPEYTSWRQYFDVIVSASKKPAFFTDNLPFMQTDERYQPSHEVHDRLERGVIYMGGNLKELHELTGLSPEKIVYVGDHIYGDILRSKKTSAWRTCMIVQEMESELEQVNAQSEQFNKLHEIEEELTRLSQSLSYAGWLERQADTFGDELTAQEGKDSPSLLALNSATKTLAQHRDRLKRRRKELLATLLETERRIDAAFNPYWGLIFKMHNKNSVFGEQVEDYACLYTSRVTNFALYSPLHYFRAPRQPMPHEMG